MAIDPRTGGQARDRIRFDHRALDSAGEASGPWQPGPTVWARVEYLRGGESVMEERLQGERPVLISVRRSSSTLEIDNAWRGVDTRDATRVFDIRSTAPNARRSWIDIIAVQKIGQVNDA